MHTVLVVDDTLFIRETIKRMIAGQGFDVIGEAENGEEAIEQYKKLHPDIVTMDITMPIKNGLEATKAIYEYDKNAKIVVITAVGQQKNVVKALKNGAKDFMTKPFDQQQLLHVLYKQVD
ncbi:response regulator [Kurthia senegalensis]|uniref:response regulator n=1 Tax=Kurthia senegalensis TaxID=1033740 RepID=UPI000287AF1A|nr:response regulator [Kurthia senegalensis]